jgi:N-acetylglucosamine-6-sulfatase
MQVITRQVSGPRAGLIAVLVGVLGVLTLGGTPGVAAPGDPADTGRSTRPPVVQPDERPNIVVILTDDQRRETLTYMPAVQRLLVDRGTRYTQAMVPTSLCCPSRATILTGRYAHSTKVFGNGDVGGARYGGWRPFKRAGMEKRTIGVALRKAGYRTALIGKYLNYFGRDSKPGYVPRGWDTFSTTMSSHGSYYGYRLNDGTRHGTAPEDYSTDVFAGKANEFIRSTPADQPLFLFFSPFGPHAPYKPAPRHDGALDGFLPPYTPATLHQKLSTMPKWMRHRRHFTQAEVDLTRQKQQEALLSVDEAVDSIHTSLQATGRDRNTLYVFMSDNGYFWGEHRIIGKDSPYKESTYIPMVVRWDGHVPAGRVSKRIVLNVDLARTLAKAAGTSMRTQGLNMFGATKRKGFVLEAMNGYNDRPAYCGWRTRHRMFVQWATGERELFDYRLDPDERHNLAEKPKWAKVRRAMQAKAFKACQPTLPGFEW